MSQQVLIGRSMIEFELSEQIARQQTHNNIVNELTPRPVAPFHVKALIIFSNPI